MFLRSDALGEILDDVYLSHPGQTRDLHGGGQSICEAPWRLSA